MTATYSEEQEYFSYLHNKSNAALSCGAALQGTLKQRNSSGGTRRGLGVYKVMVLVMLGVISSQRGVYGQSIPLEQEASSLERAQIE